MLREKKINESGFNCMFYFGIGVCIQGFIILFVTVVITLKCMIKINYHGQMYKSKEDLCN